jgi:hypothetical protein
MSITEQLRRAMGKSGRSRYALSKETGIDPATLHRFYYAEGGLSADGIDRLAEALGLELVPKQRQQKRKRG